MATSTPSVWAQMNYVPPRGQCNFKPSVLSQKCPCLRFMLHPLKSTSSFECDGCNHHASFHSMENKSDEEIRKRWDQETKEREDRDIARPRKRIREIEYAADASSTAALNSLRLIELGGDNSGEGEAGAAVRGRGKGKKRGPQGARARGKKSREAAGDGDDDFIELD